LFGASGWARRATACRRRGADHLAPRCPTGYATSCTFVASVAWQLVIRRPWRPQILQWIAEEFFNNLLTSEGFQVEKRIQHRPICGKCPSAYASCRSRTSQLSMWTTALVARLSVLEPNSACGIISTTLAFFDSNAPAEVPAALAEKRTSSLQDPDSRGF